MALKKYNVTVNKLETVLQLDEAGAKRYGLTDKDLVGAKRSPAPPPADPEAEKAAADAAAAEAEKAAKAPANKSRTAANK